MIKIMSRNRNASMSVQARRAVFVLAAQGISSSIIRSMKTLSGVFLFCLVAAVFCGCASHKQSGPVYHAGDENPPDFLVSPITMVLTNLNGFSAHVDSTLTSGEAPARTAAGDLLGRDGRLIFQPTLPLKGKRAHTEGGLFFIWDENRHSGYVLSEALQGYAPIKPVVAASGPLDLVKKSVVEEINGHPCHRSEAEISLEGGLSARLTLWQADDANHFPVRIEEVSGAKRTVLDFSEIRMGYPAQELFVPPDGFTPYANSVSLMNELIVRDASYAKKGQELDEPFDARSGSWHQGSSADPLGQPYR